MTLDGLPLAALTAAIVLCPPTAHAGEEAPAATEKPGAPKSVEEHRGEDYHIPVGITFLPGIGTNGLLGSREHLRGRGAGAPGDARLVGAGEFSSGSSGADTRAALADHAAGA